MHLIIVGGGPVGDSLLQVALAEGHDAALIEPDSDAAEDLAQKHDALILNAAITTDNILEEAGGQHADALIAATTDDAANLMAMIVGREFEIQHRISVVNQKSHEALFQRLGVRILVDPEVLVARHLFGMVQHPAADGVTSIGESAKLYELCLAADSELAGKSLATIDAESLLPEDTFIVSVQRDELAFFPRRSTELAGGDDLIVFARAALSDQNLERFSGKQ